MRSNRAEVAQVVQAAIDFGAAADAVTDQAARALGINRTDMRVLSLLRNRGETTVGRLAERAGLSPAAATVVVRRLQAAGLADQRPDPADGRRSVISLTSGAVDRLTELYEPMLAQGRAWLQDVDPEARGLLLAFLTEAERLQLELADLLAGRAGRR